MASWSTSICGCCDDCSVCCKGMCCPCCLYADIAYGAKGHGKCRAGCVYMLLTPIGCMWLYSVGSRRAIRNKYNLIDEPCSDCCTHFCCHYCALCQEGKELKIRKHAVHAPAHQHAPPPAYAQTYAPPTAHGHPHTQTHAYEPPALV